MSYIVFKILSSKALPEYISHHLPASSGIPQDPLLQRVHKDYTLKEIQLNSLGCPIYASNVLG